MKLLRTSAIAAGAVVLVGALWFLYSRTQGADFALQNRVVADLRELEALDAEWTVDALRAKTGIDRKYATGQSPAERVVQAGQQLAPRVSQAAGNEAAGKFDEARKVFAQKAELARRFAEQNRVLRESLLFVTDESADLLALLRVQQREAMQGKAARGDGVERLSELGVRINELLTETLKYNLLTEGGALKRIESNLGDLSALLPQYPAHVAGPVQQLIEKFHGVQRIKAVEDQLLGEIAALPTKQRIADTERAVEAQRKQVLESTDFYRSLLIAYSASLLALVGWFAWRLVHSYRLIQHKNAELAQANDMLEHRVEERTMELKDALDHLKESEAALIQSEKMSSLGQMIAGVAHEINTPLAYVRNGLQVLDEQVPASAGLAEETRHLLDLLASGDAPEGEVSAQYARVAELCTVASEGHTVEELAGVIKDGIYGIEQISEIVTNLKNFSRLDRSKVAHFNLNDGLESTLVIAKNVVKMKKIEKRYAREAFVTGSPSQINQVFLNLITNAAQATGADGVITLTTRVEGARAVVQVADNGSGIPPDVLPKIFDPFFTTKKIGEGTGLGLSIAYKIIGEHGGTIGVDSKVGVGTTFTISLPVEVMREQEAANEEVAHA
ncbi:DAHL domain-containing protein [Ramlibacter albus]|uniref:histidine kinase n=1 Tax=Ramlibacter albus TaxID=2079448 RepID=A0A923S4D5_9BURK|nr:DAHL domain-containing protein [Ramlibacter albus]MBC5767361.1 hypothetical protein [Ramlibacter albus]